MVEEKYNFVIFRTLKSFYDKLTVSLKPRYNFLLVHSSNENDEKALKLQQKSFYEQNWYYNYTTGVRL